MEGGLKWGGDEAGGLEAALLHWFHLFPGVHTLVSCWARGVGARGVGATLLSWFCSFGSFPCPNLALCLGVFLFSITSHLKIISRGSRLGISF